MLYTHVNQMERKHRLSGMIHEVFPSGESERIPLSITVFFSTTT